MLPFYVTVATLPYFLAFEDNSLALQTALYSVFLYYLHKLSPTLPYVLVFLPWGLFAIGRAMEYLIGQWTFQYCPSLVRPYAPQILTTEPPKTPGTPPAPPSVPSEPADE